ncbi:MAG: glycine--tRNA ligase [Patescibacteria group bacterium]|nr:glycine--tRNA ligase [Patescibacteria group bacterium]
MDQLVALAKRRGFIYPGSDLYGGVANTYDYGPMGTELLRNIKNLWWDTFVHKRTDVVGLDASLISHYKIWEASGHTAGFADAMLDCKNCKKRIRADHLIENWLETNGSEDLISKGIQMDSLSEKSLHYHLRNKKVEGLTTEQLEEFIQKFEIPCPNCGEFDWTGVRKFNLLFPVHLGIVEGDQDLAYLRGETAQGMFVNFQNVVNSTRVRLPFGIAQLGKSFRNEITPGNSVFRTLEFEQGEIEYFFDPDKTNWEEKFEEWKNFMWEFVTTRLGVHAENLRWRAHTDEERSFYSKRTEDLEYNFPFGFKELWGLAYRTNYDLSRHQEFSGRDLSITDPQTNQKILPHVIEPAVGINRLLLMVLADAFTQDTEKNRIVLKLKPSLAPVKAAVFPLLANKPELTALADKVFKALKPQVNGLVVWDDRGNIGKRYLSQDEVGTPFCITVDFQSLEDNMVTVRDRDSATQERVAIDELVGYVTSRI